MSIDEQHRFGPELWAPSGDLQSFCSNGVHGVMDLLAGRSVVEKLSEPARLCFYLAVCTTALVVAFFAIRALLAQMWPAFKAIQPAHKQLYVVANLLKASVLGSQVRAYLPRGSCIWCT